MKLPFIKFFTGDWLKDPALSLCSPATRGVWIDLLCAMHELDRSGELRGTPAQLARAARCSTVEMSHALTELQTTGAADVGERNGIVTVQNRRMKKEKTHREQMRERVSRFRSNTGGNAEVTQKFPSDLRLKSESRGQRSDKTLKSDKGGDKVFAKLTSGQQEVATRFEDALGDQWVNDSGKWVNRVKADLHKAERVVAEVVSALKEGRIKTTPAQYAEQIWKEFA
jgi:hypothetical protein